MRAVVNREIINCDINIPYSIGIISKFAFRKYTTKDVTAEKITILNKAISKCIALQNIIFILDHNINGRENITILNIPASLENSSPKTDTNTWFA